MQGGEGCVDDALHLNGEPAPRIRYGNERPSWGKSAFCGDCGTRRGNYHHPGCDMEQCLCGGQAITCGCLYDEDGPIDVLYSVGWQDGTWDTSEWEPEDHELAALVDFAQNDLVRGTRHLPLESLTRPLELRYAKTLTFAAKNGLEGSDQPTMALAWHSLRSKINTSGRLQLTRSMIVPIVNKARVLVEQSCVLWPAQFIPSLASILIAASELEVLDSKSDPLEILLQPLRCHFGLLDSQPTPATCQCFVDYDPFQRAGTVWLRIHTGQLMLALSPELVHPSPTGQNPLELFTQKYHHHDKAEMPAQFNLVLLGLIEPTSSSPLLWVYGQPQVPGPRRSLALDWEGTPYQAQPDKRYRLNHRWDEVPLWQAASGLEHVSQFDPAQT